MRRIMIFCGTIAFCCWLPWLGLAQEDIPCLGYAFPAGGQQGTTFQVLLGGNHLDGATGAVVSGDGVEVEVLEYLRPLNQGAFKELQNSMGMLQKRKRGGGDDSIVEEMAHAVLSAEEEKELQSMRARLSTFAIRRSSVPALVETVSLEVTVSGDAEPGYRMLRLMTKNGLTNPLVFHIGQLPEFSEQSARMTVIEESSKRGKRGRKRQADAQTAPGTTPLEADSDVEPEIEFPVIVNGQILPGDVDRYRFFARKGQELIVDVDARMLIPYLADAVPGWFQAVAVLYDPDGNEVSYSDDFRLHPDPLMHCIIPKDGEYTVEIYDAIYRGREDFVYRMAIGVLPRITSVFPLGGIVDRESEIQISGYNLEESKITRDFQEPGMHFISMMQKGLLTNTVSFVVDASRQIIETEPNNSIETAQRVELPLLVDGRIEEIGEKDVFSILCRKGDRIVAEVKARSLGSPLDSFLKVTNASGRTLVYNDDHTNAGNGLITHHADSLLTLDIPADGIYLVHLSDALNKGGRDRSYRLYLSHGTPDFELRAVPSSINARAGASVPITFHAIRKNGFEDAIDIDFAEVPAGFQLAGGRIPVGQHTVHATLTIPSNPKAESYRISLAGRALINGGVVTRPVVAADDMMQAFIYHHLVPADDLMVGIVKGRKRQPMTALVESPLKIPLGGEINIPVSIPSRSVFDSVKPELCDPPKGISIKETIVKDGESQIVLFCDLAKAEPGLRGNLIFNVFTEKTGEVSAHGKEQRKKRRALLSALPAIPYIIEEKTP